MLDVEEINHEIDRLKELSPTWDTFYKLSALYAVRDHLNTKQEYSRETSKSDFLKACSGADTGAVLQIIDEHMTAIKVLYNKEYQAILSKIESLKK